MRNPITSAAVVAAESVEQAWAEVGASFERFCLNAGLATLAGMMEAEARELCGPRYGRGGEKAGRRWGKTKGKVAFHGGKIEMERPRVRGRHGELPLPSWEAANGEDWLGKWALSQMLINVSTRKFARSVRLPEGDIPAPKGAGVSKSAASRRFVALSAERMKDWMAADLSKLDLLVIQIDGIHIREDLVLLAAVGVDGEGEKHPLAVMEGASENAAVCQALLDNLTERGLDPQIYRLFVIDGSKALAKAIRATFGRHAPIQRCQVHKARNIVERLPKPLHASVRKTLRQAWELADADKAERLIVNLARRLERDAPGVSASILEGLDEILTVTRLGLPLELRRSLACTNIIENMNGTIRQVCRNVKHWQDASMALRWTSAAMCEAAKGFRKLKAHKQLPALRDALAALQAKHAAQT
jgi:putative transposase